MCHAVSDRCHADIVQQCRDTQRVRVVLTQLEHDSERLGELKYPLGPSTRVRVLGLKRDSECLQRVEVDRAGLLYRPCVAKRGRRLLGEQRNGVQVRVREPRGKRPAPDVEDSQGAIVIGQRHRDRRADAVSPGRRATRE